jgi:hypothetical protein
MIHPDTELRFISPEIGHGVVATKFIPAGTITWVLDKLDREFSPAEFDKMEPLYQNILDIYTFRNNKGNFVLCWDNGRYVNHSFRSNCLTTAYDFEIAIRDIHPGEQLTDDYGYLNITEPFEGVDEGTERKVVYPDDLVRYHEIWDDQIAKVFDRIVLLDQPLLPLLDQKVWQKVNEICDGKREPDSILLNYYDPKKTK